MKNNDIEKLNKKEPSSHTIGGSMKKEAGGMAFDIQTIIMTALTTLTIFATIVMGVLLYRRYENSISQSMIENTKTIVESDADIIDNSLHDVRQIAKTINYNIMQQYEIDNPEFAQQLSILYEANKDSVQSIALYNMDGKLVLAEPIPSEKEGVDVTTQEWFMNASAQIENMHYSLPHIQNLFKSSGDSFDWVISLSQAIEINGGDSTEKGILLLDMKMSILTDTLDKINAVNTSQYFFLCDADGDLIYHPLYGEANRGYVKENSKEIAKYEDGVYDDVVDGTKRKIVVTTVSYAGWKLIGVIPEEYQEGSVLKFRYYLITTICLLMMMIIIVNRLIARRISTPILKLNDSVKAYETGEKPDIYVGGSSEIRHLGYSVQKSYEQIDKLMNEIINEQHQRRKSEIDALQSQINPHFLYNTLESITWMVEGGKNEEAVTMISELAKLLRISLSKGRTIISIEDELQHARSYMNIQKVRYKKHFEIEYDIDEEIFKYSTVKLIIQPILENAIYYGVGNMDEDDGGIIEVKGYIEDDDIYISVYDNGMGMDENTVSNILTDNSKVPKHGNGVGLINVHTRIQLLFGNEYGLIVWSEPDEGTRITIHIPKVEFTEENRTALEKQTKWKG